MADNFSALRTSRGEPSLFEQVRTTAQLTPEAQYEMTSGASDTQFEKGLRSGVVGLTAGSFANQALSQEVGDDADWQRSRDLALQTHAQGEMYTPRVSSLRDIGSLEDAGDYAAGAIGQGMMSMAPTLTAALLTRGRGKFGTVTSYAGGATTAYGLERGEAALNQYADPTLAATSAEDRDLAATTKGAINAGLESIVPASLAGSILRKPAGSFLSHVGRGALAEGLTETAQQGVGFGAEKYLDPNRQLDPWDVADAFAAGALTGGGVSAATRAPAHGAQALADRFARGQQGDAAPIDPNPPSAPPGPEDGGDADGLFDTLNERFGPGVREQAQRTKDYVSDTIDRMGEAAKTAQSPSDFLRQVFGNSSEEAAADLRPDIEDPSVLNATDPAAAMEQRDAERQQRAARFAEELLNDPATPDAIKERVASFGGDFTNPEAQAFVARNLVAQRAGEKLATAVADLIDLSKEFGTDLASKARDTVAKGMEAAADRIVKKNLQDINEADVAPLIRLLAQRLGPTKAAEAPRLARQLVAAANRLSPDARITEETDRRLRNFSEAIDDEVLDLVTELSGSDALRNSIAKIRAIPSAANDVRQSGGHSFLESMLKQPMEPAVLSQLSEFVDALGLQLGSMSSERKNQVLGALASAFGSKREAQIVVEHYGNIRRDAFRREAEADTLADDRPSTDSAPGEVVATLENPDGTLSYGSEFGTLTEQDAAEMTASYRDPTPARPFFRATDRAALRAARRAAPAGSRVATLREYVAQTGEAPQVVAARIRQDLRKRLTDAENRDTATVQEAIASMEAVPEAARNKDFNALLSRLKARKTENRPDLPGLRKQMEAIEKASGVTFKELSDLSRRIRQAEMADDAGVDNADIANLPALRKQLAKLEDRYSNNAEKVLEKYAVVMRPKDETFANDELMAKFRGLLDKLPNANVGTPAERAKKREDIVKIKKTAIKFNRKGGKTPITLSAESMAYASQARGSMKERFLDSLAAVLARPDIEGLVSPAPDTLLSRQTGLTWGDIAREKPTDNRTERQKKAQREKDATAAWAKQERMRTDIETRPKLMAALRDVQRRFLADRLELTLAPDETLSLTDLIDRFPPAMRPAMQTDANEAGFQSALGWAKKLSRKLATATKRNYADESRMRVLEKYIDEQLGDRFPMPEGDERASRRLAEEENRNGMRSDEGGIGGSILDAEAELDMLEERLDAVQGIDGLTRKYERRVEEAETALDRLADSVRTPEQRDARVPGARASEEDTGLGVGVEKRGQKAQPSAQKKEAEVGPGQPGSREAPHSIPMYYKIGNVLRLRKELRNSYSSSDSISTLIERGDRTGTTRQPPQGVLPGHYVTFPGVKGVYRVTGFEKIDLRSEAGREAWSKREGWSPEAADTFGSQVQHGKVQMQFERVDTSRPPQRESKAETVMTVRSAIRSLFNTALDNFVVVRRTAEQLFAAAGINPAKLPASVLFSYSDTQKSADASVRDFATYINTKLDADGLPYISKETRTDGDVNAIATKFLDAVARDPRLLINPVSGEKLSVSQYLTDEETGAAIDPNDPSQHWRLSDIGRRVALATMSGKISNILAEEAARITEGRDSAIVDLIQMMDRSGIGTPVERARVVIAASKYATSGTYSPTTGEVRVRADEIGDNRHGVTVNETTAKEVVKELRAGKGMKAAMKAATATSIEAARRSNARAYITGWVEFKKGSSPKVLNKAMHGTGWCTGFTDISFAATQINEGSFWAYYEDGEPQIGIRTVDGRLSPSDPPRGRLEGQRLPPKYANIAANFLENDGKVTGGEEFLAQRREKLALRELLASESMLSPKQFHDDIMVVVEEGGEVTFSAANGEKYGVENVALPASRIPPQFRGVVEAMENAAAVRFEASSLPSGLRVVRGSLFADELTSAPELREVGGKMFAHSLTSAPELREVGGEMIADVLTSAPELQVVRGNLQAAALTSAPELREVGGSLYADALTSAPELQVVHWNLQAAALTSAPALREVKGGLLADALTSAPELREVGGTLQAAALTSAPALREVKRGLFADELTSAPELREVGGALFADALTSAPKLERAGGTLQAAALTSAPALREVKGTLQAAALTSAPALREVKGSLLADALTSAPKLERAGEALFAGALTSAPALREVGGEIFAHSLTSAPALREVKGSLLADALTSAPELREVGGEMFARSLTSAPELREVGGALLADALTSAPALRVVRGNLFADALTSAPELREVGGEMFARSLTSAPELREVGGEMFADALTSAPKLSVPLHVLRNRKDDDPLDINDVPFSRDASGRVQGFVYKNKAYLAADNIENGRARGVLMHELGEHLGDLRGLLGDVNYAKLFSTVEGWANSAGKEGKIAKAAIRRAKESGNYEAELLAYAIEEAVNAGVKPTAEGVVEKWLQAVMNAFKAALKKLTGAVMNLTAQDLVDLAHGAALRKPIREMGAEARDQDSRARPEDVVVKKSFIGEKADPEGAAKASAALDSGASADMVWAMHGWFRGPDGKMRKELRSPVLRARVRKLAENLLGQRMGTAQAKSKSVPTDQFFNGVPGYENLLDSLGKYTIKLEDSPEIGLKGMVGVVAGGTRTLMMSVDGAAQKAALGKYTVAELTPLIASGVLDPTKMLSSTQDAIREGHLSRFESVEAFEREVLAEVEKTIHHELQHMLQGVEGFENGGNPTMAIVSKYGDISAFEKALKNNDLRAAMAEVDRARSAMMADIGPDADSEAVAQDLYRDLMGEVEAHDVEARFNLSDAEAKRILPEMMNPNREFLRGIKVAIDSAKLTEKLHRASKVGGRPGRPGKNWGDKDAVKAEILRLRGKDVKVRIDKLVRDLGGSGQYTYNRATGERLIEVAVNAASPLGTARHEAIHDLFRFLSKDPATRSIAKDLRDATSAPHVIRRLRELLKDHKGALEQLSDPEERAAYAYQFWAEGLLHIGPTGTGVFHTVRKFLRDLFGIVTAGQRGEDLMQAFHDGKFADPSVVQEVLQDLNDANGDRLRNKMERAAPALTDALGKVFQTAPDRLRAYQNDTLNELADMFSSERGKLGFVQKRFQQQGVWENKLAGVLAGTTAQERRAALDSLQAMKTPSTNLEKNLAEFFSQMHDYMSEAGVKTLDSKTKKWVPLREVKGYFPRVFDRHEIMKDRAGFISLLQKHGNMDLKQANAAVDALTHGTGQLELAENEHALGFTPYAQAVQDRRFTFINPSNAGEFAKYQVKDLADITTSYTKQAVHRAEYARMFDNNGEVIAKMVSESGIKDQKELGDIGKIVQGLEGSLDPGNWSVQTKEAMSALMTLQNAVVLPLAIFSQMIDPIMLAARTGDIKDAGTAYVTALKRLKNTITKSENKVSGEELANMLGIISQDSVLEAMGAAYGTAHMSKRMRDFNRVFFKYNGMQGWNSSMRIAATVAGERYILQNRNNKETLAELGLAPSDINIVHSAIGVKPDKNNNVTLRERLDVDNPKVQQAMYRFVDQAVLRPSASNRPVWMSDPRFLLVAHLKQFTFAMHNVVLKRANRELQNDNPKPWGILMLAMPVILAADMAKFALTGTAPSTWGFKDYLVHAVERSGLLGLGDFGVQAMGRVDSGKMPGEGLLGPTFENLIEILRWIGGDPRTDFGDVIDRTVPGSRFV